MTQVSGKTDRLVAKVAAIDLHVDDIESSVSAVGKLVTGAGGHVENSWVSEKDRARIVARVPADKLDATLNSLASLGLEESRSMSSEDVTEQYVDLDARLKSSIALRERLQALLSRANKVEEILQIEKELARVQSEVEALQAKLDRLRGRIQLSQLTITLERKRILGPLGYLGYGLLWGIKKLFVIN